MNAIQLSNGHANALALSLAYDPEDEEGNMLVAVVLAATSSQMLEALKAQMEKNGGNYLTAYRDDDPAINLTAAGRGYLNAKTLFLKANASGQARAHLHPLAGDPRLHPKHNYFYVVAEAGIDACQKFGQRLELATYHTIIPEWYAFLLAQGQAQGLVTTLPTIGEEGYFQTAFRVLKDDDAWGDLIRHGLTAHQIKL